MFGGIRDAAPDGWGQYLMYKAMGDRLPCEIDLILASGDSRVGALAFGSTPERPERVTLWGTGDAPGNRFTLPELAEAAERAQRVDELDENLLRLLTAGSALGGARPKAATDINGLPWIAKFQARNDTFPECRVELATMRLAGACGLDVPALAFQRVLERDIYLIERFDRLSHGNWMERRPNRALTQSLLQPPPYREWRIAKAGKLSVSPRRICASKRATAVSTSALVTPVACANFRP